jgi:hypothetical protein
MAAAGADSDPAPAAPFPVIRAVSGPGGPGTGLVSVF